MRTHTTVDSETNAAAVAASKAPGSADRRMVLTKVVASYSAAADAGAELIVTSGATELFRCAVLQHVSETFPLPLRGVPGESIVCTLEAGGAGIVGTVFGQFGVEQ